MNTQTRIEERNDADCAIDQPSFADGRVQIRAELRALNLRIEREIRRFRAELSRPVDQFRGLYVSEDQVEAALRTSEAQATVGDDALSETEMNVEARKAPRRAAHLPMQRICAIFGLDEFERNVLLLAVAPELDLRYELLYSYLNNDVTRKRPTCDLALRLFCPDAAERWTRRRHFAPDAPLFRHDLLEWLPENSDAPASSLARSFMAPLRVVDYLLETRANEARLASFTRDISPGQTWDDLRLPAEFINTLRSSRLMLGEPAEIVLVFKGNNGAGKRACSEALSAEMGCGLIVVDVPSLMASAAELPDVFKLLGREQRLSNAGLYLCGVEAFFDPEGRVLPRARGLAHSLERCVTPVVLGCEQGCDVKALLPEMRFHLFRFPTLPFTIRREAWQTAIEVAFGGRDGADVDALANQFVLTGGQIRDAVRYARDDLRLRGKSGALPCTADLFAAARMQSQRDLGSLVQRIEPVYSWDDLVLPVATLTQLREVAAALKNRHIVYTQWGFEEKLSLGKGLKALFAGESGTGKTMTAEVMARELGLDLYKIDLSTVVSKYIGETEKNLNRIFRAAQSSNAIIFFDEADALFGKRSEVKDAHDRYANIEVAYLLQKIEEYDGFVILATNLILNIDDAFKRRMNYTVEFPFPDEDHRELLWRGMFPPQTPLAEDLDFAFLARQFSMSGGNIKNAALAAAFLAAAEQSAVQMRHLIQSVAREWQKLGKLPSAADFKQYYTCALPQTSGTVKSPANATECGIG
jgi:AAA+ superfamily predicted ATPase